MVIGFLQYAVKPTFPSMDKRWLPCIAIASGVAWCVLMAAILALPLGSEAAKGFLVGLAAIGGFSGIRATSGR